MAKVDPEQVAGLLREVAHETILPRFRKLDPADIREKGKNDLVTVADTDAERLLAAALTKLLSGSMVVGEEAVAANPSVLDRLAGDAPVWILDPVDGTMAFAKGNPGFSVIVALTRGGRTVAGWIHEPVSGRMGIVEAGQGAWLDGRRVNVSSDGPIAAMTGTFWWRKPKGAVGRVRALNSWGSAGCAYLAAAAGELDFILFDRMNLNPWDHAAGVLMHAEAGGKTALLDGTPYRPLPLVDAMVVAPGPESWSRLVAAVRGD